jgi:hypothetical protein
MPVEFASAAPVNECSHTDPKNTRNWNGDVRSKVRRFSPPNSYGESMLRKVAISQFDVSFL